jgi:hypothetical protein
MINQILQGIDNYYGLILSELVPNESHMCNFEVYPIKFQLLSLYHN